MTKGCCKKEIDKTQVKLFVKKVKYNFINKAKVEKIQEGRNTMAWEWTHDHEIH